MGAGDVFTDLGYCLAHIVLVVALVPAAALVRVRVVQSLPLDRLVQQRIEVLNPLALHFLSGQAEHQRVRVLTSENGLRV